MAKALPDLRRSTLSAASADDWLRRGSALTIAGRIQMDAGLRGSH
jgi:hypothetical protein